MRCIFSTANCGDICEWTLLLLPSVRRSISTLNRVPLTFQIFVYLTKWNIFLGFVWPFKESSSDLFHAQNLHKPLWWLLKQVLPLAFAFQEMLWYSFQRKQNCVIVSVDSCMMKAFMCKVTNSQKCRYRDELKKFYSRPLWIPFFWRCMYATIYLIIILYNIHYSIWEVVMFVLSLSSISFIKNMQTNKHLRNIHLLPCCIICLIHFPLNLMFDRHHEHPEIWERKTLWSVCAENPDQGEAWPHLKWW